MNHTLHPKSSTIHSTGYDAATRTLEIKFKAHPRKGLPPGSPLPPPSHWSYADVAPQTHADMLAAPSIGAFFHAEIKPNYTATRLA